MIPSFILALREGLEAALVIGIILGVLRRTHRFQSTSQVWRGAATAAVISLAIALFLDYLELEFEGSAEMIFEGATMLVAAGLLTWMVFWMRKQNRQMTDTIESKVLDAAGSSGQGALFGLAFFSILREGVELAVYLLAARLESDPINIMVGAAGGLAFAALLGWLAFRTTGRIRLNSVFFTTNILLALFAAGLIASGVHEFIELNWLPSLHSPLWNTNSWISMESPIGQFLRALFGYNSTPTLSEVLAYLGYLAIIVAFWRSPLTTSPIRSQTEMD